VAVRLGAFQVSAKPVLQISSSFREPPAAIDRESSPLRRRRGRAVGHLDVRRAEAGQGDSRTSVASTGIFRARGSGCNKPATDMPALSFHRQTASDTTSSLTGVLHPIPERPIPGKTAAGNTLCGPWERSDSRPILRRRNELIERVIAAAFAARPEKAFSLDELAALAFPETAIERKHRAAVLRCANQVAHQLDWVRMQRPGRPLMYRRSAETKVLPLINVDV
jgi:hypothetical protein